MRPFSEGDIPRARRPMGKREWRWIAAVFLVFFAWGCRAGVSSLLFLISAVLTAPIERKDNAVRAVSERVFGRFSAAAPAALCAALLVVGVVLTPLGRSAASPQTRRAAEAVSLTESAAEPSPGSTAAPLLAEEAAPVSAERFSAEAESPAGEYDYVANENSHVFHKPDCGSVKSMNEENKQYVSGTRDELIASGYKPCGKCEP